MRMTPEFLKLKKKWDRKLGKELNAIDKTIQKTNWTFSGSSTTGGLRVFQAGPGPDVPRESVFDSDKYEAVEAVRTAARNLPDDYPKRQLIVDWAFGESRNVSGMLAVARRAGKGRQAVRTAIGKFLKKSGLANPWSHRRGAKQVDGDLCNRKDCGKLGPHSAHGEVRRFSKSEIKRMNVQRG